MDFDENPGFEKSILLRFYIGDSGEKLGFQVGIKAKRLRYGKKCKYRFVANSK